MANISLGLANADTFDTTRSLVPVALGIVSERVAVNDAAQSVIERTPAASSTSGRRYCCITHDSASEFAIGVPVANVATRSAPGVMTRPAATAWCWRRSRR